MDEVFQEQMLRRYECFRGQPFPRVDYDAPIPMEECSDREMLCKKPLVSICMVAYNHERWIAQAIESVVGQICDFEFELIIGEDCSTDGTREICIAYQKKYPGIIRLLYSKFNVGAILNSQRVLRSCRASGYVGILEGDDYWCDERKLQKQIDFIRKENLIGCVGYNYTEVDGKFEENKLTVLSGTPRVEPGTKHYFHTSTYLFCARHYLNIQRNFPQILIWYDSVFLACMNRYGEIGILPEFLSVRRVTRKGWATSLTVCGTFILNFDQLMQLCLFGPTEERNHFYRQLRDSMIIFLTIHFNDRDHLMGEQKITVRKKLCLFGILLRMAKRIGWWECMKVLVVGIVYWGRGLFRTQYKLMRFEEQG